MKNHTTKYFNLDKDGPGIDADVVIPKILFHFFGEQKDKENLDQPLQVCLNGMDVHLSYYTQRLDGYFPAIIRFKIEKPYESGADHGFKKQLIEFCSEFLPSESFEDDDEMLKNASRWFEENRGYLSCDTNPTIPFVRDVGNIITDVPKHGIGGRFT